jgi:SAM-dependent methyltransferase
MTQEEVSHCPVCNGTDFSPHFTCKDFTASGETFHVKHCIGCGLGITSPRPSEYVSLRYYASDAYISHSASSKGLFNRIYLTIRALSVRWKYSLIKPFLRDAGVLDYGCGTGSFLEELRRRDIYGVGVEPSEAARSKVVSGVITYSNLAEMPASQFDVITLWHVLEHVYDLRTTLRGLIAHMTNPGAMLIAVPNHLSPDAAHYKDQWAAYDVPRHLWHFTPSSMAMFLQQEGLRIQKVVPMKLDAYYVSLLSERNQRGKLTVAGMLSGLFNGWRSNFRARKEGNQSSLIFVVQK